MNRRPRYWFRLLRFAAALALNMERQWFIWLFVIADAYLVMTLLSAQRPFWFDELFTLYMTRLPDMATVWAALKGGADLNPPLFYAATKLFHNLSGGKEWAIRVPAIIGFLVMMFGLYRYILRYGSRLAGMVAMTFPLVTGAFYYSSEGRAYGMEFGFIAVAAVCWQAATRGEWRLYNLAGLTLCLAGALLSHCYAVLAVAPFGLAEAVRTLQRKRIDWPVWAALAVPCLSVLSYLPMMAAVTGGDPFDNPVYFTTARAAYELILGAAWWPLVFALSVLVLFGRGWRRKDGFAGT